MTHLAPRGETYECDCCGACCQSFPIFASATDAEREPEVVTQSRKLPLCLATEDWQYQLFPLPFHEACCFLGTDQLCRVYETRPGKCREFEAGSEQCQEARRRKGLERLQIAE